MLFLRESIWWLIATGLVGLMLGYTKGMPRLGFLLGLFLGPIGCGLVVMLPSQRKPRQQDAPPFAEPRSTGTGNLGATCARCGQPVAAADTVCRACGNVLLPVTYKVLE